ncbi:unnamed protein product [Spirodela intermedia]|uniref:LOB domain-containing protein n=1 Tax=Spirodela intermedia TaxID=51605 RepID=A0A7I8J187_SPIIN|nr:unnamed protein product [Spirodela intermedia]CAA6663080.1 unnamed protein product [Spirodela intermedia]
MASSPTRAPCAACKYLRRKCVPTCVFAPYFPQDRPGRFTCVHRIFGASNVSKILNDLDPVHHRRAADSLVYEAQLRLHDPVYGCVWLMALLQEILQDVNQRIHGAKTKLTALTQYGSTRNAAMNVANPFFDQNLAGHFRAAAAPPRQPTDIIRNGRASSASAYAPQIVEAHQRWNFLPGLDTQRENQALHPMGNGGGGGGSSDAAAASFSNHLVVQHPPCRS